MPMDPAALEERILAALTALDDDDFDEAARLTDEVAASLGEEDARTQHLRGMLAWADGDFELAASKLAAAVDGEGADIQTYLDCAEFHLLTGADVDMAEATLRALLARPGLDAEVAGEARVTLAQCRLEHEDADPEEALEILDELDDETAASAMARTTRAAALLDLGRADEAIELLETVDPEDPSQAADLRYQIGICHATVGRDDEAVEAMIAVRYLDAALDEFDPLEAEEESGLRSLLEELLEDLPEPLLKRVATAPIHVRERPTDAQIRSGIDPRAFVGFDGDAEAERLEGVVIMRNALLEALDDETQLPEALVEGMIDEFRRFFGLEELASATI